MPPLSARYRRRVVAGLGLPCCGDVLLMLPVDLFVPGLAMFLLAHLCFLAAWLDDSRFAARPLALLACGLAAGGLLAPLWSGLMPALRVPVPVYALVLATMAGQAVGRAWQHAPALGDGRCRHGVPHWAPCCSWRATACWPSIASTAPCRWRRCGYSAATTRRSA